MIYKITCKKCDWFVYIGETERRLCDRIQQHRGYVTQKKFKEVCEEHFNLPGHSIADMVVVGIERVLPRGDKLIRTIKEAYWINQYESFWC